MKDNPIALAHGFKYSHVCKCSQPGAVFFKGKVKLTLHSNQPTFLLKRLGNQNTSGRMEDLEGVLNQYGL